MGEMLANVNSFGRGAFPMHLEMIPPANHEMQQHHLQLQSQAGSQPTSTLMASPPIIEAHQQHQQAAFNLSYGMALPSSVGSQPPMLSQGPLTFTPGPAVSQQNPPSFSNHGLQQ